MQILKKKDAWIKSPWFVNCQGLHPCHPNNIQWTLNHSHSFISSAEKTYTLYNQPVSSHFWQGLQLFESLLPHIRMKAYRLCKKFKYNLGDIQPSIRLNIRVQQKHKPEHRNSQKRRGGEKKALPITYVSVQKNTVQLFKYQGVENAQTESSLTYINIANYVSCSDIKYRINDSFTSSKGADGSYSSYCQQIPHQTVYKSCETWHPVTYSRLTRLYYCPKTLKTYQ